MTDLSEHGNREGEGENLAMVCLPGSFIKKPDNVMTGPDACLLYTSPSPRDKRQSRMPSSA